MFARWSLYSARLFKFTFVLVRPCLSRYTKIGIFETGADRSVGIASRRPWYCCNYANRLWKEFNSSIPWLPEVLLAWFPVSVNEAKQSISVWRAREKTSGIQGIIHQVFCLAKRLPRTSALVISPLNSLIEEQVSELAKLDLSVVHFKDWKKTMQNAW